MKKILKKVYITPNQNEALEIILGIFDEEDCVSLSSLIRGFIQSSLQDYDARKAIWQEDPDFYVKYYGKEFNENNY